MTMRERIAKAQTERNDIVAEDRKQGDYMDAFVDASVEAVLSAAEAEHTEPLAYAKSLRDSLIAELIDSHQDLVDYVEEIAPKTDSSTDTMAIAYGVIKKRNRLRKTPKGE